MKPKWLLFLIPFFAIAGCIGAWPQRQPDLYLVPDGYVGWLQVFYELKNAPKLPAKQGYRVFKFPRTGVLKTSSTMLDGWAKDKFCYTTPRGWKELSLSVLDKPNSGKVLVWGGGVYNDSTIPSDDKHKEGFWPPAQYYFIGTQKQYETAKTPEYYSKEQELEFARDGGRLAQ